MKLSLAKHGGLAAGIRQPVRTLDTDKLPVAAVREVLAAVAAALAHPAAAPSPQARDAMSYVVTVEKDGTSTELRQSDASMSPAFDALIACIEKHAGKG